MASNRLTKRLQTARRRRLKGARQDIHRRGPLRRRKLPDVERVVVNGQLLNGPESLIYHALVKLKIPFEAQEALGPRRALGGGLMDFYLPTFEAELDFRGPWHFGERGRAREFVRDVTRGRYGVRRIFLDYPDLDNLEQRILELLGAPTLWSAASRRY